jgi:peptidoglycan hydrolase-like amidase
MINAQSIHGFDYKDLGWKDYNLIKKKAISEEFSFSGLVLSLSIAFFIVIISALVMASLYTSIDIKKSAVYSTGTKYTLVNKILNINTADAATINYSGEIKRGTDYLALKSGAITTYSLNIKNNGSKTWSKNEVFLETGPFLRSFSRVKDASWLNYFRPATLSQDVKPGETATIYFNIDAPKDVIGDIQENFQLVRASQPIAGTILRLFINISDNKIVAKSVAPITQPQPIVAKTPTPAPTPIPQSAVVKNTATAKASSTTFCIAAASSATSSKDNTNQYANCNTNPNETDNTNGVIKSPKFLSQEPIIRVGLFDTTATQRVTANEYFDVYSGTDLLLSGLTANYQVTVSFNFSTKIYTLTTAGANRTATKPIRIIPRDQNGIVTLTDFVNKTAWSSKYNDNQFRNIIEFNYSTVTKKLWVINELPINNYLKGLAETSDASPVEFQKVMTTAARTYAMYHYLRGVENGVLDGSTKHASEHYHVDATYDQVYRGYGSEIRMPKLAQAVNETSGMVVTYSNELVITPYFSRSDGRTRSWQEVWYGDPKPWLVSVAVPEDAGQTLWGHGVGMSARGALIMTVDENKKWDAVLQYFYQGIQLQKIY